MFYFVVSAWVQLFLLRISSSPTWTSLACLSASLSTRTSQSRSSLCGIFTPFQRSLNSPPGYSELLSYLCQAFPVLLEFGDLLVIQGLGGDPLGVHSRILDISYLIVIFYE